MTFSTRDTCQIQLKTLLCSTKSKSICTRSVLKRILQTDEGKVIVRSHDADRNAQSIYTEFLQVMMQSTEAMMDSG
jgi:phage terminase large subunit